MKKVINGLVYNSAKCTTLASRDVYSNGTYIGADTLCQTASGKLFLWVYSNGRDGHRHDGIKALDTLQDAAQAVNGWRLDDQEAQTLLELGILADA